jgi:hypothetical protein
MNTKDVGLASLLVSNNCKLVDYSTDELNQMWFQFEDTEISQDLVTGFHLATATCNVQAYLGAQKMLKALIYENRRNRYEHKLGKLDYNTAR